MGDDPSNGMNLPEALEYFASMGCVIRPINGKYSIVFSQGLGEVNRVDLTENELVRLAERHNGGFPAECGDMTLKELIAWIRKG
jgi:hypothetical protein